MFGFGKVAAPVQPSLYDIRVHSDHRNILFLQGHSGEANKLCMTGHVVFAIPQSITVKAVSLSLTGTFKLDFLESFQDRAGRIIAAVPVRKEKVIVRAEWKNLLTSSLGSLKRSGMNDRESISVQPLAAVTRLKAARQVYFDETIPAGHTPFPDTKEPAHFVLPRGNYSLPFEILLPGDIPETVEGLQCGGMLYRLLSKIEGSKQFKKEPKTAKYIRIFRAPLLEELTFSEDCTVENIWPGKVQYEVRIPSRAIPLGGKTKIHILIVPLVKGLKLGKITGSIEQYFALKGEGDESFEDEKTVFKFQLPEMPMSELDSDRWSMEANLSMPSDLKQCTPDVTLKGDLICVRNKLIFDINIINPDGHTSQVRSKLPIVFYINGQEKLLGRSTYIDNFGRVRFKPGTTPLFADDDTPLSGTTSPTYPGRSISPAPGGILLDSARPPPETSVHQVEDEGGTQQIYADPDYQTGEATVPIQLFLPSYKDSGKDTFLDPTLVSPLVSPSVVAEVPATTTSYFDLDPATIHRLSTQSSTVYISSTATTPQFDETINDVPSYNEVYDDDFIVGEEPAPLYESGT